MKDRELQDLIVSILTEKGELYGVPLMAEIKERGGIGTRYGPMYIALESLEGKGVIESREGEATPERSGNCKRYFRLAEKQQHCCGQGPFKD
jgi:PadR family transcriptional regulator PadR